jgi:hypothetical protein
VTRTRPLWLKPQAFRIRATVARDRPTEAAIRQNGCHRRPKASTLARWSSVVRVCNRCGRLDRSSSPASPSLALDKSWGQRHLRSTIKARTFGGGLGILVSVHGVSPEDRAASQTPHSPVSAREQPVEALQPERDVAAWNRSAAENSPQAQTLSRRPDRPSVQAARRETGAGNSHGPFWFPWRAGIWFVMALVR